MKKHDSRRVVLELISLWKRNQLKVQQVAILDLMDNYHTSFGKKKGLTSRLDTLSLWIEYDQAKIFILTDRLTRRPNDKDLLSRFMKALSDLGKMRSLYASAKRKCSK